MKIKDFLQKNCSPTTNFDWLKIIIGVAFLIQVGLSNQLWYSTTRTYPMVPLIGDGTFFAVSLVHFLMFILLIISFLSLIVFSKKRIASLLSVVVLLIYFLQDVVTVQAWSYQYFVMLLVIIGVHFYKKNEKTKEHAQTALQLIIGLTYIWSGIHKINIMFPEIVFSWMMESYSWLKPLSTMIWLGYAVAIFEILLGLGLLYRRFRKVFVWLSVIFHVLIVVLLMGHSWNMVVYPWNFAMIGFNFILFYKKNNTISTNWNTFFQNKIGLLFITPVIVLFGIAPLFNFFEWYDNQLSLKMYSGVSDDAVIYFEDSDLDCFEKIADTDIYYDDLSQKMELSIDDWAFKELKTPAYSGFWYYKKIARKICECVDHEKAGFVITKTHRWDWEETKYQFPCTEL